MKFQILHESKGRVRLRAVQPSMSMAQADALEAWLLTIPSVKQVTVHERTCGVIILYNGEREQLLRRIVAFSYERAADELPADEGYVTENVTSFDCSKEMLYNLRITGSPVYVFNQDGAVFNCIYPEKFSIVLAPHQSVTFVEKDKVYIEEWVEEGWDDENNRATEQYLFYNKVIIKDFEENTLSEEVGYLTPAPDGNYWMS